MKYSSSAQALKEVRLLKWRSCWYSAASLNDYKTHTERERRNSVNGSVSARQTARGKAENGPDEKGRWAGIKGRANVWNCTCKNVSYWVSGRADGVVPLIWIKSR